MMSKYNILLFVLGGLAMRDMQQGNSYQLHKPFGHTETSKKIIQTIDMLCASTREAFRMRGLAIYIYIYIYIYIDAFPWGAGHGTLR